VTHLAARGVIAEQQMVAAGDGPRYESALPGKRSGTKEEVECMTTPQPDHVTRPDFGISVRGYDRAQVDAYFGRVVEWLADAENRAMASERSREALAREVANLRTTVAMLEERAGMPAPQSMSTFSERMEQVMESALKAAQELRGEAEEEARARREAAAAEADRLVAAAKAEAEQIVEDARRAKQAMEQSVDMLHASRAEAVGALLDLQRQIAKVVGEPEPLAAPESGLLGSSDLDAKKEESDGKKEGPVGEKGRGGPGLEAEAQNEGAVRDSDGAAGRSRDPGPGSGTETETGVLVTTAPTVVQPAVAPTGGRRAIPAGSRRRTA
jgi:cell division septum initiation protein DivIVA